jgi:hypothetical protein
VALPACGVISLAGADRDCLALNSSQSFHKKEPSLVSSHALDIDLSRRLRFLLRGKPVDPRPAQYDDHRAHDQLVPAAFEKASPGALTAAVRFIEEHLPWVSAGDGLPTGMRVLSSGYLERDHPLFPAGTAYVAVGIDSWEAAKAVRAALIDIARLDNASWDLDWERGDGAFRIIRLFPDVDAFLSE